MASTFHGIETARRSLFAAQSSLNTTGHNIANTNTAGYSRQVVNLVATNPITAPGFSRHHTAGQLGTGVEAVSITRVRESFLDSQYRNENKALGQFQVRQDTLSKLEGVVNEPSQTGLRSVIAKFWNSWSDLSKDTENIDGRKVVLEQTLAMVDALNYSARQLNDLKDDLSESIEIRLKSAQSLMGTIAQLNGEIRRIEGLGDHANDLRDQRDLVTDQLSQLINVRVEEQAGGYTIFMGTRQLVAGEVATPPADVASLMEAYDAGDLNSGQLHGTIYSRDQYVESYLGELNNIATTMAFGEFEITLPKGTVLPEGTELDGVVYTGSNRILDQETVVTVKGLNGLHQLGYSLGDPSDGLPFFVFQKENGDLVTDDSAGLQGLGALNFRLNPAIAENANLIATSMRVSGAGTTGEEVINGNNSLAVLFSQMRDTRFDFDSGPDQNRNTVDAYFRSIVGQLGVQSAEATRLLNNQVIITNQVEARRQSVSGVSLDEEMANLIKFQHAYNAAARNMTVMDDTIDRIINRMGRVGL